MRWTTAPTVGLTFYGVVGFSGGGVTDLGTFLLDGQAFGPGSAEIVAMVHHPMQLPDLPEPLPICWVLEARQRSSDGPDNADAAWAVSFDLENVPRWAAVTAPFPGAPPICRDCEEWRHA